MKGFSKFIEAMTHCTFYDARDDGMRHMHETGEHPMWDSLEPRTVMMHLNVSDDCVLTLYEWARLLGVFSGTKLGGDWRYKKGYAPEVVSRFLEAVALGTVGTHWDGLYSATTKRITTIRNRRISERAGMARMTGEFVDWRTARGNSWEVDTVDDVQDIVRENRERFRDNFPLRLGRYSRRYRNYNLSDVAVKGLEDIAAELGYYTSTGRRPHPSTLLEAIGQGLIRLERINENRAYDPMEVHSV